MKECRFCEYWNRHDIGTCSQKMKTTEGNFVTVQTNSKYGCNTYSKDYSEYHTLFRMDKSRYIKISGNYTKQYLKELIKFMEEKIKEM